MLKMTVSPLAIRNSNIPNRTPLSVDMTISSSTTHRQDYETHPPRDCSGRMSPRTPTSVRAFHLAGGRKHGRGCIDLGHQLPAPAGLLLVERFLFGALAERRNIDRLEELVIVFAHVTLAAVEHL